MTKDAAIKVVRGLAKQDRSHEGEDGGGRPRDTDDAINGWYDAARSAGDQGVLDALDVLALREAAAAYDEVYPSVDEVRS